MLFGSFAAVAAFYAVASCSAVVPTKALEATMTPQQRAQEQRRVALTKDALSCRGTTYVWGGGSLSGFDCSGFTQYLFARRGIKLPHLAKLQFKMGKPVERADLRAGDLVFFNTDRGPLTHVGMCIGDGKFIHACNPRRGVITSSLSSSYYSKRYAGARRIGSRVPVG